MNTPAIGSRHVPRPRAGRGEQPLAIRQIHRRDRTATVEHDDGTKAVVTLADLRRKWQPDPGPVRGGELNAQASAPETGSALADLEAELARRNPSHPPELTRAQAQATADAVRQARRLSLAQRDALYRIASGEQSGYNRRAVGSLVALRLAFVRPEGTIEATAYGTDVVRALEHGA